MKYNVVLKSLKSAGEMIVLATEVSKANAETTRRNWRRILGNNRWEVGRRPGLDTLDHLGLTIVEDRHEEVREANKGKPGRYELQVFDLNGRRYAAHHCDGSYDFLEDALRSQQEAFANSDGDVGSCLMRDSARNHERMMR